MLGKLKNRKQTIAYLTKTKRKNWLFESQKKSKNEEWIQKRLNEEEEQRKKEDAYLSEKMDVENASK